MTAVQDMSLVARLLFEVMQALNISSMAVALVMIRFVCVMAVLPAMGEQVINTLSRMGIAMMFAVFVAFGRPYDELNALSGPQIGLIAVKEAMLGVALGFAMSTVFWVVEHVGALIDTAAGFNSVQMQNPLNGQQSTPVSDLLSRLAVAVFYAVGGTLYFAEAMFESFRAWPLLDLAPSAQGSYDVFIERQVGALFANTLKLAAPVMIVVLLIDVGVGLLARSAEKLEPSSLAQPVKGVIAVMMLTLMVSVAFDELRQFLVPTTIVKQMTPPSARDAPQK
jgi:type III secretion protein T